MKAIAISVLAGIAYFVPYLLWSQNILPQYGTAQLVSILVMPIALIVGYLMGRYHRQKYAEIEP